MNREQEEWTKKLRRYEYVCGVLVGLVIGAAIGVTALTVLLKCCGMLKGH